MSAHEPKWMALTAYADGVLSPAGSRRVEAHLAACAACREALAQMQAYAGLRGDVEALPDPAIDWDRMDLALRREARAEAARVRARAPSAWALGALAAAAALAVVWAWPSAEPGGGPDIPGERLAMGPPAAPPAADPRPTPATRLAEVTLTAGAPTVDGEPLHVGDEVGEGAALAALGGARVDLRLAEGTGFALAGALTLTSLATDDVVLTLTSGRVDSQVRTGTPYRVLAGEYEVRVRGTRFSVLRGSDGGLAVTCDEGVVEVRREGAMIQVLRAPAAWGSSDAPESAAAGEVWSPRATAGGDLATLSLPASLGMVAWDLGDGRYDTPGDLTMRAPPGPLAITGWDADGEEHRAETLLAPEGGVLPEADLTAVRPRPAVGSLPEAAIVEVVQRNRRALTACYERALRLDPELGGGFSLRVGVGRDGSVTRVRVRSSEGAVPPALAECLQTRVSRWSFPRPTGGPVTFDLPLNLTARSR